jgi:hypothetical protein
MIVVTAYAVDYCRRRYCYCFYYGAAGADHRQPGYYYRRMAFGYGFRRDAFNRAGFCHRRNGRFWQYIPVPGQDLEVR